MALTPLQEKYFEPLINRRGTHCYKWDTPEEDGVIPMWVADMDFRVAPAIEEALKRRVEQGVFGYTKVPDAYYDAVIRWFERRHGWRIHREHMIYTTGVVPAVSAVIKALTVPGDKVLVQTPVYNCFFSSIRNCGCLAEESSLRLGDDGYTVNFDDFERRCADPAVKVFLLCNPHNPAGRVWTREELEYMGEICLTHDVRVIADEIHCELVMPGHTYTPFASISEEFEENCVTCNSPSKSFNIAGLQIANIICADEVVRSRIDRVINIHEVCDVNPFGVEALMAAYNESEEWLDELNGYLHDNYLWLCGFVKDNLPAWHVLPLEGTYLAWIDIRETGLSSDAMTGRLLHEAKVLVNSGTMYGQESGEGFIRLNLACPRRQLEEAMKRIGNVELNK